MRLLELLKTFKKAEWNNCAQYLRMHYSAEGEEYALYQYIKQKQPQLKDDRLTVDFFHQKLFSSVPRKYVQNTASRLSKRIEAYITQVEIDKDTEGQKLYHFKALNGRGLYRYADQQAAKCRKKWNDTNLKDHRNFSRLLQLNHAHYLSNNPIKNTNKIDLLSELIKTYNSYAELMLKFYSFLFANEKKITDISKIEDKILDFNTHFNVDSETNLLNTLIKLRLLLTEDNNAFNYLFEELCSDSHHYSDELAIIVYEKCRVYITKQVASQKTQHSEKLLAINDIGIQRGYLLFNGRMSVLQFSNIFSTACGLGKIEWAKKYLTKYISLISIESVSFIELLSSAELHFAGHSYFNAIEILNQVELVDINLRLKQRYMLLCSFYVIHDNYSFIDAQINNYNQFIYYNKAKLSDSLFEASLNLGKIIRLLVTNKNENKTLEQINKIKHLVFRLRLPTIIEQRKIYAKKMGLNY